MGRYASQNFGTNQYTRIYDRSTYETIDIYGAKVKVIENFDKTAIDTTLWTEEVAAGGLSALTLGKPKYTLAVAAETQDAGIHGADVRYNIDKGVIFEARLAVSVLPTVTSELLIGLQNDAFASGSNLVAGADEVAKHSLFVLNGAVATGLDLVIYKDDGVDQDAVDTGINITASATGFKVFRVDATNSASVKFYVDNVRVCASTTFKMNTVANLLVMPIVCLAKNGANAGLGEIYLDYLKVWQLER
jgi:hypothetical protein